MPHHDAAFINTSSLMGGIFSWEALHRKDTVTQDRKFSEGSISIVYNSVFIV